MLTNVSQNLLFDSFDFLVGPQLGSSPLVCAPWHMAAPSVDRNTFNAAASRWRQNFKASNLELEYNQLISRWQEYSQSRNASLLRSAHPTQVSDPHRKNKIGNLWFSKTSAQAALAMKRGSTSISAMFDNMKQHPLAIGSNGELLNMMLLDGKVNGQEAKRPSRGPPGRGYRHH